MKHVLMLVAMMCGCGSQAAVETADAFRATETAPDFGDQTADMSGGDAATIDASQPTADMTSAGAADMSQPMSVPPDMAHAPEPADMAGCLSDTYIGMACTTNMQCCGLCSYSSANPTGYACCRAHHVNCQHDSDCCGDAMHPGGVCLTGQCT